MSNQQEAGPLWSDERIEALAKEIASELAIDICHAMAGVRSSHELREVDLRRQLAELATGLANAAVDSIRQDERIKELEQRLAEASSWEPVPDGEYKYPNWDDKYTVVMSVSSGGSTLGEWQDIEQWIEGYEHVDEVALPKQYRLCHRTSAPTTQDSEQEVDSNGS